LYKNCCKNAEKLTLAGLMIQFQKFTLSNGLTVIHHPDDATQLVCVNILYDVGARDERPEKTGFAHLFEHLMFSGSVNIENYDEHLEKAGGENNAFTTNDITNYYLTIPRNNVETAFWLESDRMLSLAFSEKGLDVQRNVVMEEFKQRYLNQPYGDVWLLLKPLAYKVHPYRWNTIGMELSHIENATMEDVKSFFFTHYVPSNAILVIAGNINLEKAKQLSEKWFGGIASPPKPLRQLPAEASQTEKRTLRVEREVPQDAIYKCYHMCDRNHPDYVVLDMITDALSNGQSSRFHEHLIKKKQLFSEVQAYVSGDRDPGLLVLSGKLNPEVSFEQAEAALDEELRGIIENPPEGRELEKMKNKTESLHAFTEINLMNRALGLATYEWLGDANRINTEIEQYRKVSAADFSHCASKYFTENNASVLYYAKKSS
jgi:predicted Zn-dependent peptidase